MPADVSSARRGIWAVITNWKNYFASEGTVVTLHLKSCNCCCGFISDMGCGTRPRSEDGAALAAVLDHWILRRLCVK